MTPAAPTILDNLARHLYSVYRAEVETFSDEGGRRTADFDDLPVVDKTGWRSAATAVIVEMGSMAQNTVSQLLDLQEDIAKLKEYVDLLDPKTPDPGQN